MEKGRIRAVISDLGGVIIDFDNSIYVSALAEASGKTAEEVEVAVDRNLLGDLHLGRITGQEFHGALKDRLGLKLSYQEFCRIYAGIFTLNPGTEKLLLDLKPAVSLHLLSNTNEIHWAHERARHSILGVFDTLVLSHEVGMVKPDPGIFALAVAGTGLKPEQCLFMDDVEEFVQAARAAGLEALRFTSPEAARAQLVEMGVL